MLLRTLKITHYGHLAESGPYLLRHPLTIHLDNNCGIRIPKH